MKTDETLAYSYLRFSHPDQAKGDSLRRQTDLRDAWIARNQVSLDTSVTLEDKGVSGYTGEHRSNPDRHALASFVALVKRGRVARGSYLIVESLDRLSREDILPALSLVLDLIQSGVRIVQLLPAEVVYDENANPMQLMMAVMELSRGHSESAIKAERNGNAWREKKRKAAANGEPLTARAPAWLRLVDGKWSVDERAADVVRYIYSLASDGLGTIAITKRLNAEQVGVIGSSDAWARSSVTRILGNRATVGEFQPFKGRGSKRQIDGKPIPGYYPAILTEQQFYAARASISSRREAPGRPPKGQVNIFTGMVHDARDGGMMHLSDKGKHGGGRRLSSYKAVQGTANGPETSFPLDTFERAILSCLREIDPADILPGRDRGSDEILSVVGRLAEVEAEIERVKHRLQTRYSDAVADVLERHEADVKALAAKLVVARQKAASPLHEAWAEGRALLDVLDSAVDSEETRTRLRGALRRVVEGFWALFVGRHPYRLAAVQCRFVGGGVRDYLILHRGGTGGSVGDRPSQWWVRSLTRVAKRKSLDFRRKPDVESLEKLLTGVDIESLAAALAEE